VDSSRQFATLEPMNAAPDMVKYRTSGVLRSDRIHVSAAMQGCVLRPPCAAHAEAAVIHGDDRRAFPQLNPGVVGLAGLEPAASSLSAKCREPLCGPPFPQVTPDRKGQRYAFSYGVLTPVDHCGFLDLAPRLHRLPPARTPTAMLPRDLISTTHQPDPAPTGPPPEAGHLRWEDVLMEAREEATTQVL
jgi:hypothetical protein